MRTTNAMLEHLVQQINKLTGSPATSWTMGKGGKMKANVGNYHLSGAYGGTKLVRVADESGGIHSISYGGFIRKGELYNQLQAIIEVLRQGA